MIYLTKTSELACDIIIRCKSCCVLKYFSYSLANSTKRILFLAVNANYPLQSPYRRCYTKLYLSWLLLHSIAFCYVSIHFVLSRSFGRFALLMFGCHRSAFGGSFWKGGIMKHAVILSLSIIVVGSLFEILCHIE